MEHEQVESRVARKSALIYLPISAGAAAIFFIAASVTGDYPPVARIGGMVWIGLLSLIISMPIVTSRVKKQWKGRLMAWVGGEARRRRFRKPILMGLLGAFGLFALYMTIVTLAQGWQHAVELFAQDVWLVIPIMAGFGAQVGLYTYLRSVLRQKSRTSKAMMGAGGGTSTAAMVACCAHHVADLLPLLGLSAAASFLAAYKIPFMLIGLAMNAIGVVVMLRAIRAERRRAISQERV